jgi:hypothetical protein
VGPNARREAVVVAVGKGARPRGYRGRFTRVWAEEGADGLVAGRGRAGVAKGAARAS